MIDVPVNASLSIDGRGWRCESGYQRDGYECSEIAVPANADLRLQGNSWYCLKGFERNGEVCAQVIVPANAELTWGGTDWHCLDGYQRAGGRCAPSGLSAAGGSETDCTRGLRFEDGRCRGFVIPENATYTNKGDDWTCMQGYVQKDGQCIRLSDAERQAQDRAGEIEAAIDGIEITLPAGRTVTIGDIRKSCTVVAGAGTYGRFMCNTDDLTLIETGCYVRNDQDANAPIACPSYRLLAFVERCSVSTRGSRTRMIQCPSPDYLARIEE
ncbi:hypothetical protein [Aquisalinus flavus]|uniref:Uncharacterized protein n=1 Tax=Aquisalinus flavus TaxID=1526572 RepID=A0A8J2Y3E2_9PROT|nr:hypothetical protein [Aquisalinus flavus]MBD0427716.1 hypothetical protein [Aquisalinus flavus]UNE47494.1 hypothetical protein FF099_05190 [Aquisalinus flavus]GGD03243.1 hypothetical protein GCM10011342_10310 [Aquisalinus flavus]